MKLSRAATTIGLALQVMMERKAGASIYDSFRRKYRDDPVGFARDCIDWRGEEGLTFYQEAASNALVRYKRVAERGPHGLGKTALASIIILWFALTRDGVDDWKIPTTASSWRQLTKFLWPELHKWAGRVRWDVVGRPAFDSRSELISLSLRLSTGEAFAAASSRPEFLEGAHA
jgi:hypothetical protein